MDPLHWTEIDGVPTVWVDAGRGPLAAALVFRTGYADETLVTAGWTHLIEHLAMWGVDGPADHHGGEVDMTTTTFRVWGREDDVVAFYAQVCAGLRALPASRLDVEKGVLAAEAAFRGHWAGKPLLVWRFGARRHGVFGLPQYGLRPATIDGLQELSRARFTRGNAVLWLSGPPPAHLRLDLPEGALSPPPPVVQELTGLPAWFADDQMGGVAASGLLERTTPASVLMALAKRRLTEKLRHTLGLSYAPWTAYQPLNATQAHVTLYADSTPDNRARVGEAFLDVVQDLGDGGSDVVQARDEMLAEWRSLEDRKVERTLSEVQAAAHNRLHGRAPEPAEQRIAELASVTPADVAGAARALLSTALFALPSGTQPRQVTGQRAPASREPPVRGAVYAHVDRPVDRSCFVLSDQGLTLLRQGGEPVTVRFDDLSVVLSFGDSALALVGGDGCQLLIEPTLWRRGADLRELVRRRIPAGLIIEYGPRNPASVPRPRTTRWQRLRAVPGLERAAKVVAIGIAIAVGLLLDCR